MTAVAQDSSEAFYPQQERVRRYFEQHNIPALLEQLLVDLGQKMPRDPLQGIAEWASSRQQLKGAEEGEVTVQRAPHAPPSSRPPSAPTSRPQSAHRLQSTKNLPRHWTLLLLGSEVARDHYFGLLLQGLDIQDSEVGALEEHSKSVRETIRPFFPGKKSIRMVAHTIGERSDAGQQSTAVFLDPGISTWSTEKNLFAMSIADVVILCCDPNSGTLPVRVGVNGVDEYATVARRAGVRGLMVWRTSEPSDASTPKATRDQAISAMLMPQNDGGSFVMVADVSSSSPPLVELLDTVAAMPFEALRPSQERVEPLHSGASLASSSSLMSLGSTTETEIECKIECLQGETLRRGDALKCFIGGQRIEASVVSIDIVFTDRLPTKVLRRGADSASGMEGAMVTLVAKTGSMQQAPLSAKGSPSITLVKIEPISDAVDGVISAQLLSVEVVASSSDDDDEELDF